MDNRFVSIRIKLALAFALLVAANGLFAYLYFPARAEESAKAWAHARALDLALVLADGVRAGLDFDQPDSVANVLKGLEAAEGSVYAAVYGKDGNRFQTWREAAVPEQRLRLTERTLTIEQDGILHAAARIYPPPSDDPSLVQIGLSLARLEQEGRDNRLMVGLIALVLIVAGVVFGWLVGRFLARPLRSLSDVAGRIVATGDLTVKIDVRSNDEVGRLATSFAMMVEWLRGVVGSLNTMSGSLANVTERLTATGATVANGAGVIRQQLVESTTRMAAMRGSLDGVAAHIDALQRSATQGAATIVEMATVNDEVAKKAQAMAEAVGQTAKTVERITEAFAGTARNIEELNQTLLDTASAMTEIDVSISEVGQRAGETAHLSETVSSDATTGAEALERTVHGIRDIQESSRLAQGVITRLGESVAKINTILNVIEEVTQQTNLLALNAAIIAAQAGEAGTGFGVVADEIKVLANRTGDSTTEISSLIAAIRDESQQAQVAMEAGMRNVREGVQLGDAAREALKAITDSSTRARTMVRAIAQATEEQARGTRHVADAIQRISQTVQQLNTASREQARRSSEVLETTNRARLLTQQVDRSSHEQAIGSKQVIESIEAMRQVVEQVADAQAQQSEAAQQVLGAVDAIQDVVTSQAQAVTDLEATLGTLRAQADKLRSEIARFRT